MRISFRALVLIWNDPLLYVRSDPDQGFRKGMQGPLEDTWKGYYFLIEGTQQEGLSVKNQRRIQTFQ